MKNAIERYSKDEFGMVQKIKELAVMLEELKSQQAPTIGLTSLSTVDFTLPAYNRATNDAADNTHIILMNLNPVANELCFAIPEIEMFGNVGTPTVTAADQWPEGASWDGGGNNTNFFDLDVWYDLWNNRGSGKHQAIAFIRGRSPQAINIHFVVRWRIIVPGTSV